VDNPNIYNVEGDNRLSSVKNRWLHGLHYNSWQPEVCWRFYF